MTILQRAGLAMMLAVIIAVLLGGLSSESGMVLTQWVLLAGTGIGIALLVGGEDKEE